MTSEETLDLRPAVMELGWRCYSTDAKVSTLDLDIGRCQYSTSKPLPLFLFYITSHPSLHLSQSNNIICTCLHTTRVTLIFDYELISSVWPEHRDGEVGATGYIVPIKLRTYINFYKSWSYINPPPIQTSFKCAYDERCTLSFLDI